MRVSLETKRRVSQVLRWWLLARFARVAVVGKCLRRQATCHVPDHVKLAPRRRSSRRQLIDVRTRHVQCESYSRARIKGQEQATRPAFVLRSSATPLQVRLAEDSPFTQPYAIRSHARASPPQQTPVSSSQSGVRGRPGGNLHRAGGGCGASESLVTSIETPWLPLWFLLPSLHLVPVPLRPLQPPSPTLGSLSAPSLPPYGCSRLLPLCYCPQLLASSPGSLSDPSEFPGIRH